MSLTKQELLDQQTKHALRFLGPDPANWVLPTRGIDHDVFIVGGGQTGVTTAHALRRAGISNVTVIEEAEEGQEGVWLTRARMLKLRTLKTVSGPELGNPLLTFQAWYEALHGEQAFQDIARIARTDWPKYLKWYQSLLHVPVRYRTRLLAIEPHGNHLRVRLSDRGVERVETARKVVLATGMNGTGGPFIPRTISEALPKELYAHTAERIDFDLLRGKRVAVVGAATSAFDAAATAAEHGAREVHLFSRRPDISSAGGAGARAFQGLVENFYHLPDADRWRMQFNQRTKGAVSPFDSVLRPTKFPNFYLHFNSSWQNLGEENGQVVFDDNQERFAFDFVIVGTGYQYDPHTRPELQAIAPHIALWRDRYQPPEPERSDSLGTSPYVGPAFELLEKVQGAAPYLKNIHAYNMGSGFSYGRPVGDIPGLRFEVPRLVGAISRDLLVDDFGAYRRSLQEAPDFDPAKYAHAVWRRSASPALTDGAPV